MSPLVPLVMFGWIPVVLYLFSRFPPQRAIVVSMVTAWLFLPQAIFKVPGIPPYNKMAATCYGVLLATMMFDAARLNSFRPGWLDLPMLIWCLCPFASSISNDLGPYDGFSATFAQVVTWGVPYFLGRVYLNDLKGLRELAIGIFIGGLSYIPLCLIEIRLSPQLHLWVYGFTDISFATTMRYGGYRPVVFMGTGLMLGMWMMTATLMGIWLWKTGVIKQVWGYPMSWFVLVSVITLVLVKSTGAYFLLIFSIFFLFIGKWFRTALPLLLLIVAMSAYLYTGVSGTFPDDQVVTALSKVASEDRVGSVKFRFDNEKPLAAKARQRMIFGWAGYGRNRIFDAQGNDISVTDSLWIIAFGIYGVVGLISLTAALLLPVVSFSLFRYPPSTWSNRKVAPAAGLAIALTMYMLDCILNAMVNPVFALICGGLSGLVLKETELKKVTSDRLLVAGRSPAQQRQKQPN